MAIDVQTFYARYGAMVMRRCTQLLRNEDEALDAAQDVFVALLTHRDRLDDRGASSLLYRIATNVCLNRLRRASRRPEDADDDLVLRIATAPDSEARWLAGNLLARLFGGRQAQDSGGDQKTRTIAVLHLLDGHTLEEVADIVGLSVSGVRKRLRSLRGRLAELDERSVADSPSAEVAP